MLNLKKILSQPSFTLSLAFLLTFLALPLEVFASSNIKISSWQENTHLTKTGKTSEILIEGNTAGFAPNQVMTAFSIIFDKKRHIKITQVAIGTTIANYSFTNNALVINFPKKKKNGENISIYLSYKEKYSKISKYLRQEAINIPSFAAGATSKVAINFPGYLESATLNHNVRKHGNSFIYRNIVPQGGVHEIIKLTPAQTVWDVNVKVRINANKPLKNLTVKLPTYFQSAGQKVEDLLSTSNIKPSDWSKNTDNRTFKFNTNSKNLTIHSKAKISTGKTNRKLIKRNPNDYLYVSKEDRDMLTPVLEEIKKFEKYKDLPLYAKIGTFAHEFIHYDINYLGKLPGIKDVLQNAVGVCTEYASLYNALARIAGIPSVIINGGACGEYDKCQGHAWNMIYLNNKWIEVDATWDLMSGIVSSSHVYFSDEGKGKVSIKYFGNKDVIIDSEMDFEMKEF